MSLSEDIPGECWVQADKRWIKPVVSEWIQREFPGLLENHGWWSWAGNGDDLVLHCHCGKVIATGADIDERNMIKRTGTGANKENTSYLLIHLAELIAAKMKPRRGTTISASKITFFNSDGTIMWELDRDGSATFKTEGEWLA